MMMACRVFFWAYLSIEFPGVTSAGQGESMGRCQVGVGSPEPAGGGGRGGVAGQVTEVAACAGGGDCRQQGREGRRGKGREGRNEGRKR